MTAPFGICRSQADVCVDTGAASVMYQRARHRRQRGLVPRTRVPLVGNQASYVGGGIDEFGGKTQQLRAITIDERDLKIPSSLA